MEVKRKILCTLSLFLFICGVNAQDLNSFTGSGFNIATGFTPLNAPENTVILGLQSEFDANYKWQLVNAHNTNNYYLRRYVHGWGNYHKIWHSGNFDPSNLSCSTINVNNNLSTTRSLKMFYQGSWGSPEFATDFRFIDVASSEEGSIFQMNAYGVGVGYNPPHYASQDRLYIKGRVGILTATPQYELDVVGTIRAREIKVDLQGADFVFEDDYKLMPLDKLEKFIKERKHLPEITPAREMQKNGTELGGLNSKFLQKIEEMTLYMIEQSKKIKALEEKIANLESSSK